MKVLNLHSEMGSIQGYVERLYMGKRLALA